MPKTSVLPLNDAPLMTEICLGLTWEFRLEQERSRPNTDPSQMAEAVRFELTVALTTPVFKTGALNHSATLPKL